MSIENKKEVGRNYIFYSWRCKTDSVRENDLTQKSASLLVKSQRVNVSSSIGYLLLVTATQLCCCKHKSSYRQCEKQMSVAVFQCNFIYANRQGWVWLWGSNMPTIG